MRATYRNPPLIEALCEIQFDHNNSWDETVFGHYYDRVRAQFPGKRQLPQVEMSLARHAEGMAGELRETGTRMQFISADRSAMVQVAPYMLVVNQLAPYASWPAFQAVILARLADYRQAVGAVPLRQVGLRYINRLDFAAASFSVGSALAPSDFLPVRLRQAGVPFFLRLEMPGQRDSRIVLTLGTVEPAMPDRVAVLLDLYHLRDGAAMVNDAELPNELDEAHDVIEDVFESCLTDALRRHFDREG